MLELNLWENQIPIKAVYALCVEEVCRKYGLARSEFDILMFLANNPKYDTAADIVEIKRMTKSHVSTSIRNLEQNGYLTRRCSPGNRKVMHLSLCAKADGIITEGRKALRSFGSIVFDGMSTEERAEFWSLIERMQKNINNYLEGKK